MTCRRRLAVFLCVVVAAALWHADARGGSPNDNAVLKALSKVSGGRNTMVRPKPVGTLTRLGRGAKSIALSPLEIPATMGRVTRERSLVEGLTLGALEGLGHGLSRLSAGTIDVLTAPVPGATLPPYQRKLGQASSSYGAPIVIKAR